MDKERDIQFRWVHEIGGREAAAMYLCKLGFGTSDTAQMRKRLSHWTGLGHMAGSALRAMANDRTIKPGDFDVLNREQFIESSTKGNAA